MKLSIVIVNYNVRYFLEQCLQSVYRALAGIEAEIFVVDNDSKDGSCEMVRAKFPDIKLIENQRNVGFSTANNQAIRQSKGEYILLLNPDTVVEENTFREGLEFMDSHPEAGGLGVKMIDGKGNFLPESKRGLPTPWVAFYKIFGLSSFFKKSKKFARYHLGYLPENEINEIDVLAGAFMLMRKETLDKVGLLDEDYFMYGEDIDLSYRIQKSGYKNYYFPKTKIIHYKGESTKKGSLNYVKVFYKAMAIFAEKHFSKSYAKTFNSLIGLAIYLRAGLSVLKRMANALLLPFLDAAVLLVGLHFIKEYWENNHRFIQGGEYPLGLVWTAFSLYAIVWITAIYLNAGYERPAKVANILKGIFWGGVVVLVGYSLVEETYRFSRAITILGAAWAAFSIPFFRFVWQRIFGLNLISTSQTGRRIFIVGQKNENQRIENLIKQTATKIDFIGWVSVSNSVAESKFVGSIINLTKWVQLFSIDEVIFCVKGLSYQNIFQKMEELNAENVEIKLAPAESDFVIGSNSIHAQGAFYAVQFTEIAKPANRRAKRILDILTAFFLFIFSPVLIWFIHHKSDFFKNIFAVLGNQKTWVGFDESVDTTRLPKLKNAVITISAGSDSTLTNETAIQHLNQLYAKDYRAWNDLQFIFLHFERLGG